MSATTEVIVSTTPRSIVIKTGAGDHVAEYSSNNPKADAAKMRRTIRRHLADGGTIWNYQW